MQTRTINNLIDIMLDFLNKQEAPRTTMDVWLKVISYNDIKQLRAVLEKLRERGDEFLMEENVEPLVAFLKERHVRIFTDAFPCARPDLPSVKVCHELAQQLALVTNIPAYDLLLGLKSKQYSFALVEGDLSKLPLHRIMVDKDGTPIDVLENLCGNILPLQAQAATNPQYKKFLPNGAVSKSSYFLSEEVVLLKGHSIAVKNFTLKVPNHPEEARKTLLEDFKNPNFIVSIRHGGEAFQRLMHQLFTFFASADDFIEYFADCTEPSCWKLLLQSMNMADLAKIMLDIPVMASSSSNQNPFVPLAKAIDDKLAMINEQDFNFQLGEKAIRAKLLALTNLYFFARPALSTSKSNLGMLSYFTSSLVSTSSLTGSFTREEKTVAADNFTNFLVSDYRLDQLEEYLRSVNKLDSLPSLTIKPAFSTSVLVTLTSIAKKAGEHFQPGVHVSATLGKH